MFRDVSLAILSVILLVLMIAVSPRIGVGELKYGRALELRYEDFLLIAFVYVWLLDLAVKRNLIYRSPVSKPICIYLVLATISTLIGALAGWVEPVRSLFLCYLCLTHGECCCLSSEDCKNKCWVWIG